MAIEKQHRSRWWKAERGEYHTRVIDTIGGMTNDAEPRMAYYREARRILSNGWRRGILPGEEDTPEPELYQKLGGFNALRSAVGTIAAIVSKAEPRPVYLADGNAELQRLAKDQSDAIYAVLKGSGAYEAARDAWNRHACPTGTGLMQIGVRRDPEREQAQLTFERLMPWEVMVDPIDAYYGRPRSLFRVQLWDRDAAIARFAVGPRAKTIESIIMEADSATSPIPGTMATSEVIGRVVDMIRVCWAWHLPSAEGAGDGVEVVCVDSGDLQARPWTLPYFPIVAGYWETPELGFWGEGLIEQALGLQLQLDEQERSLQDTFATQSKPLIAVPAQDKDLLQQMSAEKVRMVAYQVAPPTRLADAVVHPQVIQRARDLKSDVYEQVGTNMLSATGQRPLGLDSGKALRDYRNISTERFGLAAKHLDDFIVEIARVAEATAVQLEEEGFRVVTQLGGDAYPGGKAHKWGKAFERRGSLELTVEVASRTEKQLSGRNADLQDLFNAGAISRERFLQHFSAPDLKSYLRRETAVLDLVDKQVSQIRTMQRPVLPTELPPEAMQLVLREATLAYAQAVTDDEPDKTQELLSTYVQTVRAIVQQQQAELMQQAQAAQMAEAARAPGQGVDAAAIQATAGGGEAPPVQ